MTTKFYPFQYFIKSLYLPPIRLIKFNGNPCQWPEFLQCIKDRVHLTCSFNDSIRTDRLISLIDWEAKRVICAIGRNGVIYASAMKTLKKEFGNPYTVCVTFATQKHSRTPSISPHGNKGLRHFNQQLKRQLLG